MSNLIVVGISDQKIAMMPDVLITYALGSCVGICLYDRVLHIGGLSHVLLPNSSIGSDGNFMKYADTAIEALLKSMEVKGASRFRMTAKIAGGANMFASTTTGIGERNVQTVKSELNRLRIRLIAEDTGKDYGRTVEFHTDDGSVIIKSVTKGNKSI